MDGYIEYQRREYCHDIQCPVQALMDKQVPDSPESQAVRAICINHCIHTTYEFHHWLIKMGYLVIRPQDN